jgi:hypothetical protein
MAVKTQNISAEPNGKTVLNTSNLKNGMYYMNVVNGKSTTTQKLLIQH